jgi:hypothetical protein
MAEANAGELIDRAEEKKWKKKTTNPGAKTITGLDEVVLLQLRNEKPWRGLEDYRRRLFQITGTVASTTVICNWFLYGFGIKGKMVATSTVPIDKFSDKNIERTVEFVNYIRRLNPSRVKFGDEKHLKGKEMFDRKVRKCPVTGKVEEVVVDSDFRNTYNIVGFCGIDLEAIPMDYYISDDTNDAETFCECVERSVAKGFLRRGDTLVLDNASIHRYRAASTLEDWLWEDLGILLVFLPTRSLELSSLTVKKISSASCERNLKSWITIRQNSPGRLIV